MQMRVMLIVAMPAASPMFCATVPTIIGMVMAPSVAVAILVPIAMVEVLNFGSMVESTVG